MKPKDNLLKILDAIDYNDDKEAFAALFESLIYKQAILDLMQKLTKDTSEKLTQDLSLNVGDPARLVNELTKVLSIYYSGQEKEEALENAAKKGVAQWMQTIIPVLSNQQKRNLVAVAEGSPSTPVSSPPSSTPPSTPPTPSTPPSTPPTPSAPPTPPVPSTPPPAGS